MNNRESLWFCIGSAQAYMTAALFSFVHMGETAGALALGFAGVGGTHLAVALYIARKLTRPAAP